MFIFLMTPSFQIIIFDISICFGWKCNWSQLFNLFMYVLKRIRSTLMSLILQIKRNCGIVVRTTALQMAFPCQDFLAFVTYLAKKQTQKRRQTLLFIVKCAVVYKDTNRRLTPQLEHVDVYKFIIQWQWRTQRETDVWKCKFIYEHDFIVCYRLR